MEKTTENIIQISPKNISAPQNRVEFHNHKVVPQKENYGLKKIFHDNEWQQEYYIIYNSYALEEKEA